MRTNARALVITAVLGFVTACGAERSVALVEVAGSGVRGEVALHEAVTKSFYYRVDAYVIVTGATAPMRAVFHPGRCAGEHTGEGTNLAIHGAANEGASEIVIADGTLRDVQGKFAVRVLADDSAGAATLACADL